ncbi:vacuolar transporter chaperone, partial [Nowakowskiella sp. JEL0078]
MKFGKNLETSLRIEVWEYYYIDYNALKKQLKERTLVGDQFSEQDEKYFLDNLDKELSKVSDFCILKREEIRRRLDIAKHKLADLLKNVEPDEEELKIIETELVIQLEVFHSLQSFTRVNYTGFRKIIKKHDKRTSFRISEMFIQKLKTFLAFRNRIDISSFQISELLVLVRHKGKFPESVMKSLSPVEKLERKTFRYWVNPESGVDLEYYILKNLPVRLKNPNSEEGELVSSIYFDNETFDMYLGRLERGDGAVMIRLRWYGDTMDENKDIFIERHIHHEDFSDSQSSKEKFSIQEKNVNDFLKGSYSVQDLIDYQKTEKQMEEGDLEKLRVVATEIQELIIAKQLKPVVRTIYNRITFEMPGDSRLQVCLDSDVVAIREDNFDSVRSGDYWRRLDITNVKHEDVLNFKFATLEVKIQKDSQQSLPLWISYLDESEYVEESSQFSKFVHGVAVLYETRVNALPFWLPDLERVNLKPFPPQDEETQTKLVQQPILIRPPESQASANNQGANSSTSGNER